ncbi:MAG: WD40 repeat domain-containing protein [Armatimonadota bacterium]
MNLAARTWRKVHTRTVPAGVLAMDVHPDGKTAYVACMDKGVWAVPIAGGDPRPIARHGSWASGVRYVPVLDRIVSAAYDGTLIWSRPDGTTERTVQAHAFWSWRMRVSPDGKVVGSATGQYLAGGEKYEPRKGSEPGVRLLDAATGQPLRDFEMGPPVQSIAFSPDSRHVAAANLMGDIRVWEIATGKCLADWRTPDFTCWGIIKSHHYIGGIYDLMFSADGRELMACGMGPMVDPMAGDGVQLWQRYAWTEPSAPRVARIRESDAGGGLMESLAGHPGSGVFAMAGRLVKGKWNAALFDTATGALCDQADTKFRITDARWIDGGAKLVFAGLHTQSSKRVDGKFPDYGHMAVFELV